MNQIESKTNAKRRKFKFSIEKFFFRKAQELIGPENFTRVYNYLQEQRRDQARDSTRTDDVILSGLESLSNNSQACTLINALVLYECLNELNEQK